MSRIAILLILALAIPFASALEPMHVISPSNANIQPGGEMDLGTIGPGQTFDIQIDPLVLTGGVNDIGGRWDQAVVDSLPDGWSASPSKIYSNPMQVKVTAAPDAPDGDYRFEVKLIDEGGAEHIGGELSAFFTVHVKKDILSMSVDGPTSEEVSAGQPARYFITITNKGANDRFTVASSGVSGWSFTKEVYIAGGSPKTIMYEVVGEEEGYYKVAISARSASSPLIQASAPVSLSVHSNLIADYKATSNGVLLFPFLMAPLYSLAGLISLFLG